MRAFADGGYKILSIDTARLDGRKEYGMLIDVAFALDVDDGRRMTLSPRHDDATLQRV